MIERIKDTIVAGHPQWDSACAELRELFAVAHDGDIAAVVAAESQVKEALPSTLSSGASYLRKLIPPPHVLVPK
jgi:hypothetical protein